MHRIIVVDDEKFIRESIASFEWKTIGVEPVGCFETAEDALDYIKQNPVDIVLTDICMQGVDGIELIKQIKAIRPEMAVICISGYSNYEYLRACLKLGANDYILKPVDKEELFEAVNCALDGGRGMMLVDNRNVQNYHIDIVTKYIEEHYSEQISLEKVAAEVFLNPVYLSYLFKKVHGVKFSEYLSEIRIKNAKRLLTDTLLRIGEISELVGYREARYFSESFKNRTGMTPSEYRNKKEKTDK